MSDTDIDSLNYEAAREYVVAFIAALKRTQKERAIAQEELERSFEPGDLSSAERRQELARVLQRVGSERGIGFTRPCIALDHRVVLLKRRPLLSGGGEKANREHLLWEARQFLGEEHGAFSIARQARNTRSIS